MQELSLFAIVFAILAMSGGMGGSDKTLIYSGKIDSVVYLQAQ